MQLALHKNLLNKKEYSDNEFFTKIQIKSYLVACDNLPAKIAMSSNEHLEI